MAKLEMPAMPEIWFDGIKYWTSIDDVLGHLACWAVKQSPYTYPDNLTDAITDFKNIFPIKDEYFEIDCQELRKLVRETIEQCLLIMEWNNPRVGNHAMVFTSRYGGPDPDHDFIDLDALARNVAHSITVSKRYDNAQDEYRESTHPNYRRKDQEAEHG